jgi:hypothetical protein
MIEDDKFYSRFLLLKYYGYSNFRLGGAVGDVYAFHSLCSVGTERFVNDD